MLILFNMVIEDQPYLVCICMYFQVQSFKFLPLVYQIASRMGSSKDDQGTYNFQVWPIDDIFKFSSTSFSF